MSVYVETEVSARAAAVVDRLRKAHMTVVTAESCTGGLVAAALSHGENASECLHGGFVTYTKTQKITALGVDGAVLRDRGAVNEVVAVGMADGALRQSQATMAVSVTGVLGPGPDEDGNPPGLVYFGLARSGSATIFTRYELGAMDPDLMRKCIVLKAFDVLLSGVTSTDCGHQSAKSSADTPLECAP